MNSSTISECSGPAECWACQRLNTVPIWEGVAVPIVRCHWCGALIEDCSEETLIAGTGDAIKDNSTQKTCVNGPNYKQLRPRRTTLNTAVGLLAATLVLFQICYVAATGILVVLPEIMLNTKLEPLLFISQFTAGCLGIAIIYFYAATTLRHPGPITPEVSSMLATPETIPKCGLYDFRWCATCQYAKPPSAHHCRRCATCVDGLDHHCFYTANRCIGNGNIEAFLWFLRSVLIGALWAAAASMTLGWKHREAVVMLTLTTWQKKVPLGLIGSMVSFSTRWVWQAPRVLALWAVAMVMTLAASIGVALLLQRQLRVKNKGLTILEEMRLMRTEGIGNEEIGGGLKMKGM